MGELKHRFIETNGIRMRLTEKGAGPPVVLCHGYPESWYSWRHQIDDLATAGFHVVAPDMRGYGQTDRPDEIEKYTLLHLAGDMVGLLDALDAPTAAIAGHDWGAPVAWCAALLRPDRFRAVIGLSVPYWPRGALLRTTDMKQTADKVFYQLYFQPPGVAEADFERDLRLYLRFAFYFHSGEFPRKSLGEAAADSVGMVPRTGDLLTLMANPLVNPAVLPAWISETDVDVYAGEFSRTGLRGGLNWYRNIDRNWELLAAFDGAHVAVPALYMVGDRDLTLTFQGMDELLSRLSTSIPGLRETVILPGCGHWTQQERPREVSAAMIEFLRHL